MEVYLKEKLTTHFYEQKQQLIESLSTRAGQGVDWIWCWHKKGRDEHLLQRMEELVSIGSIKIAESDKAPLEEICWELESVCELIDELESLKELAIKGKMVEIVLSAINQSH